MLESSWSNPQSDITEELGIASAGDSKLAVTLPSFCTDFANDAAPRQRCVIPKVQPSQLNRSDQRVPVYWDQTVPVWQAGGASTTKRKAASHHGRSSRRFEGGGGASSPDTTSLESCCCCCCCCCCCSRRDDGRRRNDSTDGTSSEVSFDAILSMYESSLVEKSFKWSRRDNWWVLGALLKRRRRKPRHDERRGLWPRSFVGRRKFSAISVLSASPGAALKRLGEVDHEVESVRSLRVAIERTSICDRSPACNNSHCGIRLLNADSIFQGRSCDFQNQLRNRRDPLSFTTPMLTTSSS